MSATYDDFGYEPLDTLCRVWHNDEDMTDEAEAGLHLLGAAQDLLEACKASLRIAEAWMKDAAPTEDWEDVKNNPEYAAAKQHADMLREIINKAEGRP